MAGSSSLSSPFVGALTDGTLKSMGTAPSYVPIANTAPNYSSLTATPTTYSPAGTISDPSNPTVLGASTVNNTGGSTSNQLGGGSASISLFQPLYDAQIASYQNQLDNVPNMQNAEQATTQNLYNPQANTLNSQHAQGAANLDLAQNQLDEQHSRGLRNIGDQLRTALNGYQQQLGVMGAGDSSASGLLGYGLTQQGNNQTFDLNQQNNDQQSGLNLQRKDLEDNFNNQMDNLNAWKQSQLSNIALKYSQMQTALQNQIEGTRGEEARYLAMYGQTALAQQAIASLQALQSQYADQAGQLQSHFSQVNANTPQADISKYAGQYAINPFDIQSLQGLNFANNQATNPAPTQTALLNKRPDQSPTPNLGV